jgi:hypothetical protein
MMTINGSLWMTRSQPTIKAATGRPQGRSRKARIRPVKSVPFTQTKRVRPLARFRVHNSNSLGLIGIGAPRCRQSMKALHCPSIGTLFAFLSRKPRRGIR